MSTAFTFTALPVEIRVMIYRMAFVDIYPVLVGSSFESVPAFALHSAQLLRTCKTCHKEGSPILYGENVFVMYSRWGTETANIVRSFERFGRNADLIRHLQAWEYGLDALKQIRSMRGLRCMLQNLDTLSITLSKRDGTHKYYMPRSPTQRSLTHELCAWLTSTRGAFQKLTRIFVARSRILTDYNDYSRTIHLISEDTKAEPEVSSFRKRVTSEPLNDRLRRAKSSISIVKLQVLGPHDGTVR
jgi:hypothetical protein